MQPSSTSTKRTQLALPTLPRSAHAYISPSSQDDHATPTRSASKSSTSPVSTGSVRETLFGGSRAAREPPIAIGDKIVRVAVNSGVAERAVVAAREDDVVVVLVTQREALGRSDVDERAALTNGERDVAVVRLAGEQAVTSASTPSGAYAVESSSLMPEKVISSAMGR